MWYHPPPNLLQVLFGHLCIVLQPTYAIEVILTIMLGILHLQIVLYFNLDYRPVHRLWIWIAIQTQPRKINFENQVCHGKINMLFSERDQILFHQGLLLSLHPAVLPVTRRKITLDTQNPPPVIHLTYWRVWTKTQYLVIFKIIAKLLCCYEIIYFYKWNQWNG